MKLTITLNKDDEFLESIIPKYDKNVPIDKEEALKLKIFCSNFPHKPNETKTVLRTYRKGNKKLKRSRYAFKFYCKKLFS